MSACPKLTTAEFRGNFQRGLWNLLSVAQQRKLPARAGTPAPLGFSSVFPVGRASVPGGRLPSHCVCCATLSTIDERAISTQVFRPANSSAWPCARCTVTMASGVAHAWGRLGSGLFAIARPPAKDPPLFGALPWR
jgi:hypothetical protein